MRRNPADSDATKELESIIGLLPEKKTKLPELKMEQKEAKAILGYITYLEKFAMSHTPGLVTSEDLTPVKDYDKQSLDTGLVKLVGMASGLRSSSQKKQNE